MKINNIFWKENVQRNINSIYSACGSLYEWEKKLNKEQLNIVTVATGYYCDKRWDMFIYASMGKISTLEN